MTMGTTLMPEFNPATDLRVRLAERLVPKCRVYAGKKHRFTRACALRGRKMPLCICGYHEGSLTWA